MLKWDRGLSKKQKIEASVEKAEAEAQTVQAVARALELEAMLK